MNKSDRDRKALQQLGKSKSLTQRARLITESPCFTVKNKNHLFACGTEKGKIFVADMSEGWLHRELSPSET